MNDIKVISDAEYKAYQDKVKPFQSAIDLVTLAQHCVLFGWDVSHSFDGKYMHAAIEKGYKEKVQQILARHGINAKWEENKFLQADEFILPTKDAEQHPILKSMRAVKMEGGKTSSTNLVLQLAQLMPNQK